MSKPTDNQDKTKKVIEVIQKIIKESSDGVYIYRGEPYPYDKVSSSLYREYEGMELEHFISDIQKEILKEAKTYTRETDEFNILSQLQHYGGKTNLIDFTTDYNIALFFACQSKPEEKGRVILKKKENVNAYIRQPRIPAERIIAQKSVFIQPPKGFEEPDKVVCICAKLKEHILDHLRRYHNISTKTIYNDLHGFIKTQKIHKSEYTKFLKGNRYIIEEKYDKAIECYTEAIHLFPQFALAYNNRGSAKIGLGRHEEAIEDCNRAIEINPQYAEAYNNRGFAKTELGRYGEAIEDCNRAIEINPQSATAYNNRGSAKTKLGRYKEAIEDFDRAIEINPQLALAYYNRGFAKIKLGRYKEAIEDFDRAIEINPQSVHAYYCRGIALLLLSEWESAKTDLTTAKNHGVDIVKLFQEVYRSVTEFEKKFNATLPTDIKALLTYKSRD